MIYVTFWQKTNDIFKYTDISKLRGNNNKAWHFLNKVGCSIRNNS